MNLRRPVTGATVNTKWTGLLLGALLVIASFLSAPAAGFGIVAAQAADAGERPLQLQRTVQHETLAAGEVADIRLSVYNGEGATVSVTLTEEIPHGLDVLDAGAGAYNATAGFIVWRNTLAPGETATVGYTARVGGEAGTLPLYAYASTSLGVSADSEDVLTVHDVPVTFRLDDTSVQRDEETRLHLRAQNPFNRPLSIDLDLSAPADLVLSEPLPTELTLAAEEAFARTFLVEAAHSGRYPLSVTPRIAERTAGETHRVTLTVYGSDEPAVTADVVAEQRGTTPGAAERTHRLTFPDGVLVTGEQLIVATPLPDGTTYMRGSTTVNDRGLDDPIVRDGHLLFYVPSEPELILRYGLLYSDRERIGEEETAARTSEQLGIMSVGVVPRLLRGDESLLTLLQGEAPRRERVREGIVLLNLYDGQILGEASQTDIEVDGPLGVDVSLTVNGEEIGGERIGAEGVDEALGRRASKYIAVPLKPGANEIVAAARTDVASLRDAITVYRSGAVTELAVHPLTPLETGRVRPLIFQVTAADASGLPPADGTIATVYVHGGEIVSADARPEWLGHQVELYDGRGYVLVEAPTRPAELGVELSVGEAKTHPRYDVTTRAEDWSILGHGIVRLDAGVGGEGFDAITVRSTVRMFAQGPLGDEAVLTVAANTSDLDEKADAFADLWTGDGSSDGTSAPAEGPLFVRLERGLSYGQYGRDAVQFDGRLANYTKTQHGVHAVWRDVPGLDVRGFYAQEAIDTRQEVFDGDGTGYYRLENHPVEPFSDELAIVVRDRFYPHDIVRVLPLARTRYYLDDATGRIILTEPLPSVDEDGNRITLRARYRLAGTGDTGVAAGVRVGYEADGWDASGAVFTRPTSTGEAVLVGSIAGAAELGSFFVGLEGARSEVQSSTGAVATAGAHAYTVSAGHKDVLGWGLEAEHRVVQPDFTGSDTAADVGIVTSLRANRSFQNRLDVVASTALSRKHVSAPWRRSTSANVRWLSGRLRPEVGVTARDGEAQSPGLSGRVGVSADAAIGTFSYAHEWPLIGLAASRHLIDAQIDIARNQRFQLSVDLSRPEGGGDAVAKVGLGFTSAHVGERTTTRLRGGYELPGRTDMSEGHYVLGVSTDYEINERHTLQWSLDHRRPMLPASPSGFGSSLGWKYKHKERGESEWRLDFYSEGDRTKHALQWRGLHPLNDHWTLRANALLTSDGPDALRHRVSVGSAYRGEGSALLAEWLTEGATGGDGADSSEWRVQGATRFGESLVGSIGYALRQTGVSTTDKTNVGAIFHLRERLDLLAELSYLRQLQSETSRLGGMLGVSYELFEHVWLTGGYGTDDYVGYDMSGAAFNRTRSGVFVQLDFAFDEWTLRRMFTRRPGRVPTD